MNFPPNIYNIDQITQVKFFDKKRNALIFRKESRIFFGLMVWDKEGYYEGNFFIDKDMPSPEIYFHEDDHSITRHEHILIKFSDGSSKIIWSTNDDPKAAKRMFLTLNDIIQNKINWD